MAGKDRKRQIARERYQRRMAAKALARAKARQRWAMGLSAGGVVAIAAIVLLIALPSKHKKPVSSVSPTASTASSTSAAPAPTTANGCTTKPSVVATRVAGFPSVPPGADAQLKTEPTVTIPAGKVPTKTEVKDLVVGTGATVKPTDSVTVNYLGVNYVDCAEFDSSWSNNKEATFSLTQVVPGFTKGIGGDTASGIAPMKVGGRREIIVTPADGYGVAGAAPKIAPNEELVFVVDLVGTAAASASPSASQ